MKPLSQQELIQAIHRFQIEGDIVSIEPNNNGHINDTFIVSALSPKGKKRYIIQRINASVFPRIDQVMENIELVLSFLAEKVKQRGGDVEKEKLTLIQTREGRPYFEDVDGCYFRAYAYLEGSKAYNSCGPEILGKSGFAFGQFQADLSSFPAEKLHEVLPHFHDTPKRYADLLKAIEGASKERREEAAEEIVWAKENAPIAHFLTGRGLPLRVTHNDTKLNNVLFYEDGKSCVIDLDTIMPGYSLYDFGDSIRFGANEAAEDEKDLSKVKLSLECFEAYTRGYLEGARGKLTPEEIALFPEAGMTLTYECGIRFLTDFLQGDVYFKTAYPMHNLVRAKGQFALVEDMKKKLPEMRSIVAKYR